MVGPAPAMHLCSVPVGERGWLGHLSIHRVVGRLLGGATVRALPVQVSVGVPTASLACHGVQYCSRGGRNIGIRAEILTDTQNKSKWLGYSTVLPPPIPPQFFEVSDGAASSSEVDTPGALWSCDEQAHTMTCEGIDAFAEEVNTNFCLYEVSSRPWKYTNCRRRLSTTSNRTISYHPGSRWTCNTETNEMECRATAWTAEAGGCDEPSLFDPDYQPFCVPSTATANCGPSRSRRAMRC